MINFTGWPRKWDHFVLLLNFLLRYTFETTWPLATNQRHNDATVAKTGRKLKKMQILLMCIQCFIDVSIEQAKSCLTFCATLWSWRSQLFYHSPSVGGSLTELDRRPFLRWYNLRDKTIRDTQWKRMIRYGISHSCCCCCCCCCNRATSGERHRHYSALAVADNINTVYTVDVRLSTLACSCLAVSSCINRIHHVLYHTRTLVGYRPTLWCQTRS